MINMKHFFKKLILNCLYRLGVLSFVHYKNRHKITVLMLHGVMTTHSNVKWNPLRSQLPPCELKRTLQSLSRYYQFINVEECIAMLEGGIPFVDNGLLITFDDGYRNNIDYALPICNEFGIKPLMFVATGHVDSGLPFWFDRLDYALQQNMGKPISLEYQGVEYRFDATTQQSLKSSYQKFRDDCKDTFTDDIAMNDLFDALSEILELRSGRALRDICLEDEWSSIASWLQLKEAVKSDRLDVASHTVNHWRLDSLPEAKLASQLQQSKIRVEEELSTKCNYFCYPNGNYNQLAIQLIKESGYKAAFSTDIGLCESKDDLMTLKRFNFPANKTVPEILYQLNR